MKQYRYYDKETCGLDISGMLEDLSVRNIFKEYINLIGNLFCTKIIGSKQFVRLGGLNVEIVFFSLTNFRTLKFLINVQGNVRQR